MTADITKPVNTELTFRDMSSGSPTSFSWDFGDGTEPVTTPLKSTRHTYTTVGVYTITHTVTGAGGTTTCLKSIEITAGGISPLVIIPVAVAAAGIIVYLSRRQK